VRRHAVRNTECAAVLDILKTRALLPLESCRNGRTLPVRIVQMLTRLSAVSTSK
jgi:hypothetical protein